MKEKEYLMKVHRSRTSYFFIYFIMLIIILFLIIFNNFISHLLISISFALIVFSILIIEVHRLREWWAITNSSLIHSFSILNKNVREVGFSSISDLDLDQPLFDRIMHHGTVNVRLFLNETSIKITDIHNPIDFIECLQEKVIKERMKRDGTKKL